MLSDEGDVMPARKPEPKKPAAKSIAKQQPEEDEEPELGAQNGDNDQEDNDEDDDDDDSDEYVVEKILSHSLDEKGTTFLYEVKWLGYPNKADRTWEPEANLMDGAMDILQSYWDSIGGQPQLKPKTPAKSKRGRKSAAASDTPKSDAPASKRAKRSKTTEEVAPKTEELLLPEGTWEDSIQLIDAIEQREDSGYDGFVLWNNGQRTHHQTSLLRQKCPLKVRNHAPSKNDCLLTPKAHRFLRVQTVSPISQHRDCPQETQD